MKGTMVTKLPSTIIKLQKLTYLRAGTIAVDDDDRYATISGPHKLQQYWKRVTDEPTEEFRLLVANACLMANVWLRGLDQHGVEVPREIGKLRALQTLGVVNVARGKNVLEEIKKLSQLRKLGITGINKNNCMGLESVLYSRNLQSLSMRTEGKDGLADCLSSVFSDGNDIRPLGHLRRLKLFGKLLKLPEWIEELPSLVKLTLQGTGLQRDAVEVLGALTNLTSLRLCKESFMGNGLHFRKKTFTSLAVLELCGLVNVKSVTFEESATPQLKLLKVECWWDWDAGCCSFTGLKHLTNLMEVHVQGLDCGDWEENLQEPGVNVSKRMTRQLEKQKEFKDELSGQLDPKKSSLKNRG